MRPPAFARPHSKICENLVPTEDATTVVKLYQAGGVLLGKLATHEFANGEPTFELLAGCDNRAPLAQLCIDHMQFGSINPCGRAGSPQRPAE